MPICEEITLRPLPEAEREGEIPALLDLWEGSVAATHHFITPEEVAEMRPEVGDLLRRIPHLHLAYHGGQLAGFAGVSGENLDMLFSSPRHLGQGVGRALLTHAVHGLGVRTLDVNEENPAALGFYRHMGFEVVSRSPLDGQGRPHPVLLMRLAEQG